jgi:hypothetical protein
MPKLKSYLSRAQRNTLRKETAGISRNVRSKFERHYAAWRKTWSEPHLAFLSDPSALRFSKEFADLAGLGADILPLVIEKLAQPSEFFALQLYDALQVDPSLRIEAESEGVQIFKGEQGRAERVVKHWLAR